MQVIFTEHKANHLTGATIQAANLVDYNKLMPTKNNCTQLKKSCQKENQEGQVALDHSPDYLVLQFLIHGYGKLSHASWQCLQIKFV